MTYRVATVRMTHRRRGPGERLLAALLVAGAILSGCGRWPGGDAAEPGRRTGAAPLAGSGEVEAPEVFQATGRGVWDGRPSLGGTWVAYPDVAVPERVVIRDVESGRETRGALFRREREMPGPGFQVSSDAAEALGLVAGEPAELAVTALRPGAPADAPPDGADAVGLPPSVAVEATPLAAGGDESGDPDP